MRGGYDRQPTSVLTWILSAIIAGFVLQSLQGVLGRWMGSNTIEGLFALTAASLKQGHVWTLASYVLLHAGLLHFLLNGLGIFLLGRELVPLLGSRRFLGVFAATAVAGSTLWLAVHYFTGGGTLVGASGCVAALFILFACFYPEREITFLLFFVLPVTLKPKYAAWTLAGVHVLGFLLSELPGRVFDTGIAHSAQLGAMLAGWVYFRFIHANNGWDRASSFSLPPWRSGSAKDHPDSDELAVNPAKSAGDLRAEVDRILDKINSEGFGALTDEEKRVLDEAKDMLSRH